MAKLIAVTTPSGEKVWISPDHVVKLSAYRARETIVSLSSPTYESSGNDILVGGSLEEIAGAINGHR